MTPHPSAEGAQLEALTDEAVELIWHAFPGYSAETVDRDDVVDSVRRNVEIALEAVRRGSPPSPGRLRDAGSLGARRARQAVPLESVIQAYRSTERVILLHLFDRARRSPAPASERADLVLTTFDLLTQAMIDAFRDTSSDLTGARRRLENELVREIAAGHRVPADRLSSWSRSLGIPLDATWFAIALVEAAPRSDGATADDVQLNLQRARRAVASRLAPLTAAVVFGDAGDQAIGLVSVRADRGPALGGIRQTLADSPGGIRIVCGVGEIVDALADAASSIRQALDAARAARLRPDADAVEFREALLEVLLAGRTEAAEALFRTRIAPLDRHPALRATLEALLDEDLSQAAAARRLHVHVNTMSHRIRRIAELTGGDPTRLENATALRLALLWSRMRGI
ncbi:PucR family transcriptional regulator [Pseudolysinimonas sp.]|uniref:PucR family transcriptional regulator n=1 Tax=Pseudolysinimonas sp. TaxID=2680009 RepID=UPI003F7D6D64